MRARWLKPEFFRDRKIGALGPVPALVYEALWCVADDGGTAPCDADRLKGEMFYFWPMLDAATIEGALVALEGAGRIRRYQAGDDTFCRIAKFSAHQKVHKPSAFRYPQLGASLSPGSAALVPEGSGTPHILDTQTPRLPASIAAAAPVAADYLTRCVVALNLALASNPKLRGHAREIAASTQAGKVVWAEDGIPIEVAEAVIREKGAQFTPSGPRKQIHSLSYFDSAVRERWAAVQARGGGDVAAVPGARDSIDAAWLKAQGY